MADISKLKLNNVEYNIKDAEARAAIHDPDWEAAQNEDGYIENKPAIKAGTGTDAIISGLLEDTVINDVEYQANIASGDYSFAEGFNTIALGKKSHVEGSSVIASGSASHAEGSGSKQESSYTVTSVNG